MGKTYHVAEFLVDGSPEGSAEKARVLSGKTIRISGTPKDLSGNPIPTEATYKVKGTEVSTKFPDVVALLVPQEGSFRVGIHRTFDIEVLN